MAARAVADWWRQYIAPSYIALRPSSFVALREISLALAGGNARWRSSQNISENRMVFWHEYPLLVSVALAMNSNPVAHHCPKRWEPAFCSDCKYLSNL